jgi:hypothetical protein
LGEFFVALFNIYANVAVGFSQIGFVDLAKVFDDKAFEGVR